MSGIYVLAFSSIAPSAIICGLSIAVTKRYRPQIWFGWAILMAGFGLMSKILATDSLAKSIGYFVILGFGAGCVVILDGRLFPLIPKLQSTTVY